MKTMPIATPEPVPMVPPAAPNFPVRFSLPKYGLVRSHAAKTDMIAFRICSTTREIAVGIMLF